MKTLTSFQKLIISAIFFSLALLALNSCSSAKYCPSYSGHSYNKSGGKKINTSVHANRKKR